MVVVVVVVRVHGVAVEWPRWACAKQRTITVGVVVVVVGVVVVVVMVVLVIVGVLEPHAVVVREVMMRSMWPQRP